MALSNNKSRRIPCKAPQSEHALNKTSKELSISSRDQYELIKNNQNQGICKRQQSEIYIVDPTQQTQYDRTKERLDRTEFISKKRGFSLDHVKSYQGYSKIKSNSNQYTLSTENLACFAPTYNTNTTNYDSSIQVGDTYANAAAGVNISRQATININKINQQKIEKIGQNNGSFDFIFSRGSLKRDDANNSQSYSKPQLIDRSKQPTYRPQEIGFYHGKKKSSNTVKERRQVVKADQHISSYDYQPPHSQSYWDDLEECISSSLPPIALRIDKTRKKEKPNQPKTQLYRPLQDPDKILQFIDAKELGFDTTDDVIQAVELAEKNTYNHIGAKKRAQLCPAFQKEFDEKPKEILHQCLGGQILKLNMAFNVDKNDEIKGYVERKQNLQLEAEHQAYLRESSFQDSPSYQTTQTNTRPPSGRNNSYSSMGRQTSGIAIQKENNSLRRNQREKQTGSTNPKDNSFSDIDCFHEEKLENRQLSKSIKEAATADASSLNRIRKYSQSNKISSNEKAMTKIARLIHQIQYEDPVT